MDLLKPIMAMIKRELQNKRTAETEDFVGESNFERRAAGRSRSRTGASSSRSFATSSAPSPSPASQPDPVAAGPSNNPGHHAAAAAGNPNCSRSSASASAELDPLPRREVVRRLRALREPATVFGEVVRRLRALREPARSARLAQLVLRPGGGAADDDLDATEGRMVSRKRRRKAGAGGGDGGACDADLEGMMRTKFEELCEEDRILVFFKRLLNEWKRELDGMPELEKRTADGKMMVERFDQCTRDLEPLFEFCRKKVLADDIREALLDIVECCMKRDYLAAMEKYIKLTVGNKPWTMGVTMVGIHERSAREKICTNSVAHIMDDETTRRYLQSIKRLITLCEVHNPELLEDQCSRATCRTNGSDLLVLCNREWIGQTFRGKSKVD